MFAASLLVKSSLADQLALILAGLRGVLAARMAADRALAPLLTLLWSRLHRAADRFSRTVARVAPAPEFPVRAARPSGPADRLPRGVAWLIRLVPEAAAYGAQLQALIADPTMAALIAAVPQAGRIVRPLCRMLAVPPGPALRPTAAAPKPRVPPVDPDLPERDPSRRMDTQHEPDALAHFACA